MSVDDRVSVRNVHMIGSFYYQRVNTHTLIVLSHSVLSLTSANSRWIAANASVDFMRCYFCIFGSLIKAAIPF